MKLTPSQIVKLQKYQRFKKKRMRKKFWAQPLRYIRGVDFSFMLEMYTPIELLQEVIPRNWVLDCIEPDTEFYQPVNIPLVYGSTS